MLVNESWTITDNLIGQMCKLYEYMYHLFSSNLKLNIPYINIHWGPTLHIKRTCPERAHHPLPFSALCIQVWTKKFKEGVERGGIIISWDYVRILWKGSAIFEWPWQRDLFRHYTPFKVPCYLLGWSINYYIIVCNMDTMEPRVVPSINRWLSYTGSNTIEIAQMGTVSWVYGRVLFIWRYLRQL